MLQKVFDKIAKHLLKQGRRSTVGGKCAYRGKDGTRCAVGCLIKNKFFKERLNLLTMFHPDVLVALRSSGIDTANVTLMRMLSELQLVHDDNHPRSWRKELAAVAMAFDLEFTS